MLKKTLLLLCAAALLFTLAGVAAAADGYSGHYVSFAYDEEGKGKPVDNAHGFPAKYVAHFQVSDGGTYEALIFGALTTGTWRIMKTKKGNEFVGMTIEKTTDKQLKETYGTGQPAFMLVRHTEVENAFKLLQLSSDEVVYLEKRAGKLDVDKVLDEVEKYLAGGK